MSNVRNQVNLKTFIGNESLNTGSSRALRCVAYQLIWKRADSTPETLNSESDTKSITLTDSNKTNLIIQLAQQGHILADYEEQLELNATDLINDPTLNINNTFITPSKKITEGQYRNNFDKTLTDINELFKEPLTPEEEQLLKIINLLGIEITNLADTMGEMASNIKGNNFTQEELEAILFPKASTLTDLDSAILCINGSGEDVNNICNP